MPILKQRVLRLSVSWTLRKSGTRKQRRKKPFLFIVLKLINILSNMALTDKEPTTKIEKWLLRLGVIGTAIWQLIQFLLNSWPGNAPTPGL